MSLKRLGLAAVSAIAFTLPAWGHHSAVMYDRDQTLSLEATVKEFNVTNPHSWLYVTVVDESGQIREWALETSSPASLARRGWTQDTLEPGEQITVSFNPMRDGSLGGELESVTLADGQTLR